VFGDDGTYLFKGDFTTLTSNMGASLEVQFSRYKTMSSAFEIEGEGQEHGASVSLALFSSFLCAGGGHCQSNGKSGWYISFGLGGSVAPIDYRIAFTNAEIITDYNTKNKMTRYLLTMAREQIADARLERLKKIPQLRKEVQIDKTGTAQRKLNLLEEEIETYDAILERIDGTFEQWNSEE
jgi:hypothetical protein